MPAADLHDLVVPVRVGETRYLRRYSPGQIRVPKLLDVFDGRSLRSLKLQASGFRFDFADGDAAVR
jgi:hypothetical protein